MNPDTPQTPREEIEVKITAMLMGELSPEEAAALQTQIAATDRQIDTLVYELYGLTSDEIKIVEQDRNEPATPANADDAEGGTEA